VPHLRDVRPKTLRSTVSYLIVRDRAHENSYAKALETLGVDGKKLLPIPKTDAERFPEVKEMVDLGWQSERYTFDLTGLSEAGKIIRGTSPSDDGTDLDGTEQAPGGAPMTIAEERYEEFAPGLDPELIELIQATAALEVEEPVMTYGPLVRSLA
jgi:Mn-containing catalase